MDNFEKKVKLIFELKNVINSSDNLYYVYQDWVKQTAYTLRAGTVTQENKTPPRDSERVCCWSLWWVFCNRLSKTSWNDIIRSEVRRRDRDIFTINTHKTILTEFGMFILRERTVFCCCRRYILKRWMFWSHHREMFWKMERGEGRLRTQRVTFLT